jgi:hypothetical protein
VRELAAEGNIPVQVAEPQSYVPTRKTEASFHSESTEEEKNHVIKVLEHESKLYHFEKNFLRMMSQNQPLSQGPKPSGFRVSSPIYEVNENTPY